MKRACLKFSSHLRFGSEQHMSDLLNIDRHMKQTVNALKVFLFVSLFSVTTIQAQNAETAKTSASIDFETEIIDYGTINQHSNGVKVFAFTNTGNAPLIISEVKTSCGCTVPTFSKEAILPGEKGEIEIKYDTKRLGAFTKTVTVLSNANQTRKTLKIKGNIVVAK